MTENIKKDIRDGKLPLHIISIINKKSGGTIVKVKNNIKYKTNFFQLSPFYKSVI